MSFPWRPCKLWVQTKLMAGLTVKLVRVNTVITWPMKFQTDLGQSSEALGPRNT